jgi:hypothetical protein
VSHSHPHHHAHGHAAPRRAAEAVPKWSLLRASLGERLAGVALLLATLWALVFWALQS